MHIQSNRLNTYTLQTVTASVGHTTRLIGRVCNKHGGVREAELLRLVQAFSVSKITFSLPYLHLTRAEEDKVNSLIRRLYKFALGVPSRASTERLLATGTLNTFSELAEAHLTAQYQRLSNTHTGRHILNSLSIAPAPMTNEKFNIPHSIHEHFHIPPLPKNMHPVHHEHRRQQRAKALQKKLFNYKDVLYVDAAEYPCRHKFAISVVDSTGSIATGASIIACSSEEAEEAAVALAATIPNYSVIVSDSKTAIHNFGAGRVCRTAWQFYLTIRQPNF